MRPTTKESQLKEGSTQKKIRERRKAQMMDGGMNGRNERGENGQRKVGNEKSNS